MSLLTEQTDTILALIRRELKAYKWPLDRVVGVVPPGTLPGGGNTGSGYTPAPHALSGDRHTGPLDVPTQVTDGTITPEKLSFDPATTGDLAGYVPLVGDSTITGSLTLTGNLAADHGTFGSSVNILGSVSASNISGTPTSYYIPKADGFGKLDAGWLPDLSSLYMPTSGGVFSGTVNVGEGGSPIDSTGLVAYATALALQGVATASGGIAMRATAGHTGAVPLRVDAGAGQTADLFQVVVNSSLKLSLDASANLTITGNVAANNISTSSGASRIPQTTSGSSTLDAGWIPALSLLSGTITDSQHGSRGGGSLHAVATTGAAGFLSAADKTKLDGVATGATANTGTVTSVDLSLPALFSVSGSPITTSGTLTATLATQAANKVFAGPTSGSAAAPTVRSLVLADLPSGVALTASNNSFSQGQYIRSNSTSQNALEIGRQSDGAVTFAVNYRGQLTGGVSGYIYPINPILADNAVGFGSQFAFMAGIGNVADLVVGAYIPSGTTYARSINNTDLARIRMTAAASGNVGGASTIDFQEAIGGTGAITWTTHCRMDALSTSSQSSFWLSHNGTLKRVLIGAADSAGTGYRSLYIAN